jgi:hypothetical protein
VTPAESWIVISQVAGALLALAYLLRVGLEAGATWRDRRRQERRVAAMLRLVRPVSVTREQQLAAAFRLAPPNDPRRI